MVKYLSHKSCPPFARRLHFSINGKALFVETIIIPDVYLSGNLAIVMSFNSGTSLATSGRRSSMYTRGMSGGGILGLVSLALATSGGLLKTAILSVG